MDATTMLGETWVVLIWQDGKATPCLSFHQWDQADALRKRLLADPANHGCAITVDSTEAWERNKHRDMALTAHGATVARTLE
ncbi:MAG TPA: hypothetical protein VGU23_01635 [Acidobacteriaceae bacterium]|nr:hypothetical protein [Acidobacteriaceae bacterium]